MTRLSTDAVRGEALGLYAALAGLGAGVGSALGGVVADWSGYLPAFVLAGLLVLLGTAVALATLLES